MPFELVIPVDVSTLFCEQISGYFICALKKKLDKILSDDVML